MILKMGTLPVVLAAGMLLAAPACAPKGGVLEPVSSSRRSAQLHGEIRSIDTWRGRIHLREDRGRNRTVRYDRYTRVVHGNRQYPVSALERGDRVRIRVVYDRSGNAVAERIDIRQSVRDRGGIGRRVERLAGTVRHLDVRRGYFTLEQGRSRSVVVRVSNNIRREDARRFSRLRRGDRVRVDVLPVNRSTVQLIRFR